MLRTAFYVFVVLLHAVKFSQHLVMCLTMQAVLYERELCKWNVSVVFLCKHFEI